MSIRPTLPTTTTTTSRSTACSRPTAPCCDRHFDRPGLVADLGCGTGRALVPLVRTGHRGLAVDLSEHMLRVVQEKADDEGLPIDCVRANLVELDAIADGVRRLRDVPVQHAGHDPRPRQPPQGARPRPPHPQAGRPVRAARTQLLVQPPRPRRAGVGDRQPADGAVPPRGGNRRPLVSLPRPAEHVSARVSLAGTSGRPTRRRLSNPSNASRSTRPDGSALTRPWLFAALRTNGWIVTCEA